jgi:hypothetical protein
MMDKVTKALKRLVDALSIKRVYIEVPCDEYKMICAVGGSKNPYQQASEALAALESGELVVVDKERLAKALTGDCPLRAIDIEGKYCIKYDYDCPTCLMAYIQPREEDSDERD